MENATSVWVSLSSDAVDMDGVMEAPTQILVPGKLLWKGEGCLLHYAEGIPDDEGGSTGTEVRLRMERDRVIMMRVGPFGTTMVFARNRRFEGMYHTPYGDLPMAVYATRVESELSPTGGRVRLEYQLEMQGEPAGMRKLRIEYFMPEQT